MHIHTTASDGKLTVNEIINMACKNDVKYIAITDHDSVEVVKKAIELGKEKGIIVIPGIEMTVNWKSIVHILGYFIDTNDNSILDACNTIHNSRVTELINVIRNLKKLGIQIDVIDIKLQKLDSITSIAKYLVKKGYGSNTEEILNKYLRRGGLAYVARHGLEAKRAISVIKNAGGVAVLAHPDRIKVTEFELFQYIDELVNAGLDGIEVYSEHNKNVKKYKEYCIERKLLITGGSDFHNLQENEIGKYKGREIPFDIVFKCVGNMIRK